MLESRLVVKILVVIHRYSVFLLYDLNYLKGIGNFFSKIVLEKLNMRSFEVWKEVFGGISVCLASFSSVSWSSGERTAFIIKVSGELDGVLLSSLVSYVKIIRLVLRFFWWERFWIHHWRVMTNLGNFWCFLSGVLFDFKDIGGRVMREEEPHKRGILITKL